MLIEQMMARASAERDQLKEVVRAALPLVRQHADAGDLGAKNVLRRMEGVLRVPEYQQQPEIRRLPRLG